jgi:hypothetical protein
MRKLVCTILSHLELWFNIVFDGNFKKTYKFFIEELGLRFIRAISKRGLATKIILSIIAFNIIQMMKNGFDGK